MKTSYIIGGIVALIVLVGIGIVVFNNNQGVSSTTDLQATTTSEATNAAPAKTSGTKTTTTTTTVTAGKTAVQATTAANEVPTVAKSFVVNGNDTTADLKRIVVAEGTTVKITFGADAGSTYHGGLDFRSPSIDTGTIAPGSTETVSFVATKSFSFIPYWPDTNIAKPYTIDIVVQ